MMRGYFLAGTIIALSGCGGKPEPAGSVYYDPSTEPAEAATHHTFEMLKEGESGRRFMVTNLLAGPLQISFSLKKGVNIATDPALPLKVTLPALATRDVLYVTTGKEFGVSEFEIERITVPGNPRGKHDISNYYEVPFAKGTDWELHQEFHGEFSHRLPQSRYALDFAVDEGTPILAVREGTVMEIEQRFVRSGTDREFFATRANHIRVLHADGSMADYAHLAPHSAEVALGQKVRRGDVLAKSGATGYTTGPHLHFSIQLNQRGELVSVPFRMVGVEPTWD